MKQPLRVKKTIIFNLINLFLIISTLIISIIVLTATPTTDGIDLGNNGGAHYLITFTVESNIFLGCVALVALIATTIRRRKVTKTPTTAKTAKTAKSAAAKVRISAPSFLPPLYLTAASLTMLTYLLVVFYLAPTTTTFGESYFYLFSGTMFFFHFFNPILAAINFVAFFPKSKNQPKITLKARFLPLIPLALYGIFYFTGVITSAFADFYSLTAGGDYKVLPLSILAIAAIVVLSSFTLATLYNKPHYYN